MTDDEIPRDISLWKCTIKKSWHVTTTILNYLVTVVAWGIILSGAFAGIYIIYLMCVNLLPLWSILSGTFFGVIGLFYLIPWWVYVIIAAIAAIPVYSFAWCLNRDMTEEDRNASTGIPPSGGIFMVAVAIIGGVIGLYNGWYFGYNMSIPQLAEASGVMGAFVGGFALAVVGLIMGAIIGDIILVFRHYYIRKKGEI